MQFLNSDQEFVILTITRKAIAENANGMAYRLGLRIIPFYPGDERLTDEVCGNLARQLPTDYGNPSADHCEEMAYVEMMRDVGAITAEDAAKYFGEDATEEEAA